MRWKPSRYVPTLSSELSLISVDESRNNPTQDAIVSNWPIVEGRSQWRFLSHVANSDLGAISSERPVQSFEGFEWTEMVIAMPKETDQPITLRGLGICVLVRLCPAREGNGATFPGSSDFRARVALKLYFFFTLVEISHDQIIKDFSTFYFRLLTQQVASLSFWTTLGRKCFCCGSLHCWRNAFFSSPLHPLGWCVTVVSAWYRLASQPADVQLLISLGLAVYCTSTLVAHVYPDIETCLCPPHFYINVTDVDVLAKQSAYVACEKCFAFSGLNKHLVKFL